MKRRLAWDTVLYLLALVLLFLGFLLFFWLRSSAKSKFARFGDGARNIAIRPDNSLIAVAHKWGQVNIWQPASGKLLYTLPYPGQLEPGNPSPKTIIDFTHDGLLALWEQSYETSLWDLTPQQPRLIRKLQGSRLEFASLEFAAASPFAFSHRKDRISVWNHETGARLFETTLKPTPSDNLTAVAISPDGQKLAALTYVRGRQLHLWQLPSGREEAFGECEFYTGIWFSPNGRTLFAYKLSPPPLPDVDGFLSLHELQLSPLVCPRAEQFQIRITPRDPLRSIDSLDGSRWESRELAQISPSGEVIATSSNRGVLIHDRQHGRTLSLSDQDDVVALAISRDGSQVVTATDMGEIRVYDTPSGHLLSQFGVINRSVATLLAMFVCSVLSAAAGLAFSFRQYHRFRGRSVTQAPETVDVNEYPSDKEFEVNDFTVPSQWAETEITSQLRQLRESKPSLIPHFVESIKERFIVRQDDRTAQQRLQFLKTQVEQLRAAKDFHEAVNDLAMLSLERKKRLKTLELEVARLDEQIDGIHNPPKAETKLSPEQERAKRHEESDLRLISLQKQRRKAEKITNEQMRALKVMALDDEIRHEMKVWSETLP